MVINKWIKAIITKPKTLLKSFIFRFKDRNKDLAITRLNICNECPEKINTSFGDICNHCGCILDNKTRIEDEHCDLCKW